MQSVGFLTFGFGLSRDLGVMGSSPASGSAPGEESAWDFLSLYPSTPSKKQKNLQRKKETVHTEYLAQHLVTVTIAGFIMTQLLAWH